MRAAYPKALTSAFVDSRTESIIEIIGEETSLRANRMFRFGGGDNTPATPTTVVGQKSRACFHVCTAYLGVDRVLSVVCPCSCGIPGRTLCIPDNTLKTSAI
jgi:hypothetical protein